MKNLRKTLMVHAAVFLVVLFSANSKLNASEEQSNSRDTPFGKRKTGTETSQGSKRHHANDDSTSSFLDDKELVAFERERAIYPLVFNENYMNFVENKLKSTEKLENIDERFDFNALIARDLNLSDFISAILDDVKAAVFCKQLILHAKKNIKNEASQERQLLNDAYAKFIFFLDQTFVKIEHPYLSAENVSLDKIHQDLNTYKMLFNCDDVSKDLHQQMLKYMSPESLEDMAEIPSFKHYSKSIDRIDLIEDKNEKWDFAYISLASEINFSKKLEEIWKNLDATLKLFFNIHREMLASTQYKELTNLYSQITAPLTPPETRQTSINLLIKKSKKLLENFSENQKIVGFLVCALAENGEYDESLIVLRDVMGVTGPRLRNKPFAKTFSTLGYIFQKGKNYQGSIACSQKAFELDPEGEYINRAHVYYGLGIAQFHNKNFAEAIESGNQALTLAPEGEYINRAHVYYVLGMSQAKLGEAQENTEALKVAIESWRKGLAQNPSKEMSERLNKSIKRVESKLRINSGA